MTCAGSKIKYARNICSILQQVIREKNISTYIECFVGGANIIDKIACQTRIGYDRSDTLIALLNQAVTNWEKIPKEGSKELWEKGKAYVKDGKMPSDMSLADIGAIEYFASFSNGGFPSGYAKNTATRNYYKEAYCNLKRQVPALKGIIFHCQNYWELKPTEGALVYLDPPYASIKHNYYVRQQKMDYEHFWNWTRELSKNNYVYISELSAPDDFEIVWHAPEKRIRGISNFNTVEKLFRWKEGLK